MVKIPDLPAASAVAVTDNLVIDQGGTTRKASLQQIRGTVAGTVGGTGDAITITCNPAFNAYVANMLIIFTAPGSNATATPTVNVDGLGAKTIKKYGGAPAVGDIQGEGTYIAIYDGTYADIIGIAPAPMQMGPHTLMGNNTGGTANAADLTVSQVSTMLGLGTAAPLDAGTGANQVPQRDANGNLNVVADYMGQVDKGTVSSGTVTFTFSAGASQRLQVGGALTIATDGWPAIGNTALMLLELVNAGSATLTLPGWNWVKPDGTTTTSFSAYCTAIGITGLQASGTDRVLLMTNDGGATVSARIVR